MPTLKHVVIFIYIAELIVFGMLFVGRRRAGTSLREQPEALLCAFMIFRVLVKLVYFYVEYYILPWHLNILFNSLMDTTYVISLWLAMRVVCSRMGTRLPRPRLYALAAMLYVIGFATISYLWVDRASNHLILITEGVPQVLYNLNELLFLVVAITTVVTIALRARGTGSSSLALAIAIVVSAYAFYVFLWDVSFTIPGVDALRLTKPFDGVLFFAAALAFVLVRLCPPEQPVPEAAPSSAVDLEAFAADYGLTTREAEVLGLLFRGMSTAQVAEELSISTNTAKRHTYNLYRKAGVGSRYELLYKVGHPDEEIPSLSSDNDGE